MKKISRINRDVLLENFIKYPSDCEVYIKIDENGTDGEIIIIGKPKDEENHDCAFIGCPIDAHIIFKASCSMIFQ